jgi:hypothetical protein
MPGPVPGIHVLKRSKRSREKKTWMAGTYAKTRFARWLGHDDNFIEHE